ncbi:MAG: hypothetical protein ACI944_001940, partial [Natronomonas sp.]
RRVTAGVRHGYISRFGSRPGTVRAVAVRCTVSVGADGDPAGVNLGRGNGTAGALDGPAEAVRGDASLVRGCRQIQRSTLVQGHRGPQRVLMHISSDETGHNNSIER